MRLTLHLFLQTAPYINTSLLLCLSATVCGLMQLSGDQLLHTHRRNKARGESRVGSAVVMGGKALVDRTSFSSPGLTVSRAFFLGAPKVNITIYPQTRQDFLVRFRESCHNLPGAGFEPRTITEVTVSVASTIILAQATGARGLQEASRALQAEGHCQCPVRKKPVLSLRRRGLESPSLLPLLDSQVYYCIPES